MARLVWSKNEVARRVSRWGSESTPGEAANKAAQKRAQRKKQKKAAAKLKAEAAKQAAQATSNEPSEKKSKAAQIQSQFEKTDSLLERRRTSFEKSLHEKMEDKANRQGIVRNDTPEKREKRLKSMAKRQLEDDTHPVAVEKVKRRSFKM